jgi:hypothetical protein
VVGLRVDAGGLSLAAATGGAPRSWIGGAATDVPGRRDAGIRRPRAGRRRGWWFWSSWECPVGNQMLLIWPPARMVVLVFMGMSGSAAAAGETAGAEVGFGLHGNVLVSRRRGRNRRSGGWFWSSWECPRQPPPRERPPERRLVLVFMGMSSSAADAGETAGAEVGPGLHGNVLVSRRRGRDRRSGGWSWSSWECPRQPPTRERPPERRLVLVFMGMSGSAGDAGETAGAEVGFGLHGNVLCFRCCPFGRRRGGWFWSSWECPVFQMLLIWPPARRLVLVFMGMSCVSDAADLAAGAEVGPGLHGNVLWVFQMLPSWPPARRLVLVFMVLLGT